MLYSNLNLNVKFTLPVTRSTQMKAHLHVDGVIALHC